MNSTRCGCKYLRRRCPSDCILSPYFPPNDPDRFAYVHKICGASNIGKMLEKVPANQRAEAANTIYFEAYCRIKDPVYGSAGIITNLNQEIYYAQGQQAKIQAEIAVLNGLHAQTEPPCEQVTVAPSFVNYSQGGNGTFSLTYEPSTPQFY